MDVSSEQSAPAFLPLENPLARAAREARYRFAREQFRGERVLEAGCGARDGAVRLAVQGSWVAAVDLSRDGVLLAARAHFHPLVHYAIMDCLHLGFSDASFDLVVSFEVVEHVRDPEAYVREMARVLKPDGCYIGSTPNRERPDFRPNPHHVQEFSPLEYRRLLSRHFAKVDLYGQNARPVVEGRGVAFRRGLIRHDRFGLRRMIPQRAKDWINRTVFHLKSAHLVDAGDYDFRIDEIARAPVLVCVCKQ
jgi:SAM-dependent methyltransferase